MSDTKVVAYFLGSDSRELSVTEVMENDGDLCGPEWGWIALGEIVEHGFALDTDLEIWELHTNATPALLVAEMNDYWTRHPEMAEDGEYSLPPTL